MLRLHESAKMHQMLNANSVKSLGEEERLQVRISHTSELNV